MDEEKANNKARILETDAPRYRSDAPNSPANEERFPSQLLASVCGTCEYPFLSVELFGKDGPPRLARTAIILSPLAT